MYQEVIDKISSSAETKRELFITNRKAYLLHGILAGAYIGLGIVLIFVIGAPLAEAHSPYTSLIMGATFGIALSLVILAGADLFTGNTLVLSMGLLNGRLNWNETIKMMTVNYFANFAGSLMVAFIVYQAGTFSSPTNEHFLAFIAAKKMHLSFTSLFFRGILCNWLVTLSVWCCYRLKSEAAKLVMIFWCLLGFIGPGYEHSIANMTLLSLANLVSSSHDISWNGVLHNLIPVTLGNMVSGIGFVACTYWSIRPKLKPILSPTDFHLK